MVGCLGSEGDGVVSLVPSRFAELVVGLGEGFDWEARKRWYCTVAIGRNMSRRLARMTANMRGEDRKEGMLFAMRCLCMPDPRILGHAALIGFEFGEECR